MSLHGKAMESTRFRRYLEERGASAEEIELSLGVEPSIESFVREQPDTETRFSDRMGAYRPLFDHMLASGTDTAAHLLAVARYGAHTGNQPLYAAALETIEDGDVLRAVRDQISRTEGARQAETIFADFPFPRTGADPRTRAAATAALMSRLEEHLTASVTHRILYAVRHNLPKDFRSDEREYFLTASGLDAYLEDARERLLETLRRCRDEGTLFFNQPITPRAYEYVRSHPEIAGAVRSGDSLYRTKIPYMIDDYLGAETDAERRYYACHCPWARGSIAPSNLRDGLSPVASVDAAFCSCSAGFIAQPLEQAFDRPIEAEILETALSGSTRCRFRFPVPKDIR